LLFSPLKVFRKLPPLNPQRILIVRLDHIGDFVCTTPIFRNLKAQFPNAKITALVNPSVKDLAEKDTSIDKVIVFRAFWLERDKKSFSLREAIKLIKNIRKEKFDLGIEPRGDLFSIILMFLGKVKYRIGYGVTGGGFLLTQEVRYSKNKHIIERNLNLLHALNISIQFNLPQVIYNKEDEVFVDKLLESIEYNGNKAVVLHPFAGTKAKQWSEVNTERLIDCLINDNWKVFIVGALTDKGKYNNIVYDLRGRLSLPQLAYLMKKIGLFVGLDSGPANIAATLNIHTVVICSGTNIAQNWISKGDRLTFIYRDVDCKPCEQTVCPKEKHYCMDLITVEEVLEKIGELKD
jgi:ADP-heptose:LPS heptosyltransferase